jgi:hypothetical protein
MASFPGANDITTANGLFKVVYGDLENIIPIGKKIAEMIPFLAKAKTGQAFNTAIILGLEHGVTYEASDAGAFQLNDAVPGAVKQATIKGNQIVLRSAMSYESIFRSDGKDQSFEETGKYVIQNMMDSLYKKLEVELLYGQDGISTVDSTAVANTVTSVQLLAADFASGIWSGSRGMKVDFYNGATPVAGGLARIVQRVDLTTQILTLDASTPLSAVPGSNFTIYPYNAYGKQMLGMKKIMENTGVMFGIDAAQYELWEGTQFVLPVADVLSFAVIQQAITKGVEKGLDKDAVVLCNPGHWDDLLTEQSALRQFDSSYSSAQAENGSKSIKFHSQNGMVEIVPYIHVKQGHAFIICKDDWKRIGSTDVTFKRPGQPDKYFLELQSHAGVELRAYTDQAVICRAPGKQVIIKNLKVS